MYVCTMYVHHYRETTRPKYNMYKKHYWAPILAMASAHTYNVTVFLLFANNKKFPDL